MPQLEPILQPLAQSPHLTRSVQQLQELLAAEAQQRQAFYANLDENVKAEFINGAVVVHSPVRLQHSEASDNLYTLMRVYLGKHPLGMVRHEKVMIRLTRNDYEPDICFFRGTTAASFTPRQTIFPAPDLIVEVLSDATAAHDRGVKFEDYAAHGVAEYWLVDPAQREVEQYLLQDGQYHLHTQGSSGTISSQVITGFSIPIMAIFDSQQHQHALQALVAGQPREYPA